MLTLLDRKLFGSRSGVDQRPDAQIVRGRMRALAEAGARREAVAFADEHVMRLDDPALFAELASLRREAVREATADARPRADWPPRTVDPFPAHDGIPEIDGEALSAEALGGAIQHHGSLIVRGLLPRDVATTLASDVDMAFECHDRWRDDHGQVDGRWFSPFGLEVSEPLALARHWVRLGGGVYAADSPLLLNRLAQLYRESGVIAAVEGYLGERPVLSVGKTVLRKVKPAGPNGFHQDGAFLGANVRTVNVWIALSDCGEDAPGLDIVDRRLPGILETGTEGAHFHWSVGREVACRANGGRPFASPRFRPGDALIFDQFMLHATSFDPAMTRPRHAIEAWFFAPSAYTEEQVPLLI